MRLDIDPAWRLWLVNDEVYASCDEGWRGILGDLFRAFDDVLRHVLPPGARITILQIKEKYAGLRVYWQEENVTRAQHETLAEFYRRAQDLSYVTCERCGRPGEMRQRGHWFATRCSDHLP